MGMKCRSAFSLTELIVVVAVVTLLLGVLVPSLQAVRETSRAVVCNSNLHQIQAGWLLFIGQEPGGRIPYTVNYGRYMLSTTGNHNWLEALAVVFPEMPQQYSQNTNSFNVCPQALAEYGSINYNAAYWGYAINMWWSNRTQEYNEHKSWYAIAQPHRYPWFVDSHVYESTTGFKGTAWTPHRKYDPSKFDEDEQVYWGIGAIHANGTRTNVAYADGSSRSAPMSRVREGLIEKGNYPWLSHD